jgi:hypothetical protein
MWTHEEIILALSMLCMIQFTLAIMLGWIIGKK